MLTDRDIDLMARKILRCGCWDRRRKWHPDEAYSDSLVEMSMHVHHESADNPTEADRAALRRLAAECD